MNARIGRIIVVLVMLLSLLAACGGSETPTTGGATEPTSGATTPTESSGGTQATTTGGTDSGGTSGGAAASGEPILIGIAVAQTGNVALFGQEQVIGAQIAEKFFNDRGGVNGRPIKLVFQDTGGDEAGAINAFQSLINQDKVVGIVGPTLSQQAFSADPIAEQAEVPVIGPSNTAKGIPQIGNYIARVSAPVTSVAPNALQEALAIKPDIKSAAVLYAQNDAFSKSETGVFQNAITSTLGWELTSVQTFQTTDTDFTAQATSVINENPDVVVISGLAADGGNLVKQLRELGYKGLIVGGNGFNTTNIFPVCQQFCDGIIVAQAYSYQLDSEVNNAFREAYKAQQGKEPPQFSAQAFAGVQVFVEALSEVDSATALSSLSLKEMRQRLNEQLLKGTYQTPLGEISFTPEGDINQSKFYVALVKMNESGTDGTFEFRK